MTVYATHTEVSGVSAVLNERINDVSASIPELPAEEEVEFEEIDLSDYALASAIPDVSNLVTHDEFVSAVTAVSSMIPDDYVTHSEVSAVSANLVNYVNSVSGDITNYVDESIVSAINVATGSFEQVQSDWTEDDTNDPAYIQHKPNEIEIVAGQNIGIFTDATTITIAASGEQVPNVSIQSPSGTLVINETVTGNSKIYSIDVAPTSGIEYGQFYATNITGAATMSRTKGNIDITNDGKIKLKKGQSYHITVRGRYNQSVLKDNYGYASYIEYVTNNSININVDESRSGSQYFELSYDLFKLNNDTDYYVFFTLDDATVNDLFIEVHSLANVGGNGSSGGSSPEYDAGYGIQILNNVISVSGIAPQIQSDWAQTNTTSVDYIKNKPEEYGLLAGDNISITASGNNFVISSTASAATGIDYQAGYGIDITGDTISVDASIIPEQQVNSDWTATSGVAEILNKPNESELIAGAGVSITASGSNYIISAVVTGSPVISGYVTEAELETVSGNIVNLIPDISGLATNADLQIVSAAIPDVSNLATKTEVSNVEADVQIVSAAIPTLPSEEEVEFEEIDLSDYALASSIPVVSGFATKTELATVSGNIVNQIPDVSNFVTEPTVSAIVEEALVDVPSGVSGVVAGDGISITASGSNYVISCSVTGTGDVTRADLASVSGILESQIQTVSGAIPDISGLATEADLQIVSAAIPDISGLATKVELSTASGTLNTKIDTVSGNIPTLPDEEEVEFEEVDLSDYALASSIPDVSNLASKSEVNAVSGTLQTEIVAISGAMVDVPTGVSGVVAGQGIAITASGSDYVISCTVTGTGDVTRADLVAVSGNLETEIQVVSAAIPNQVSGASGVKVEDSIVSLDNPVGLCAGENITITVSGDSAIISGQAGGGSTYTAGNYISIDNSNVISVTGLYPNNVFIAEYGRTTQSELWAAWQANKEIFVHYRESYENDYNLPLNQHPNGWGTLFTFSGELYAETGYSNSGYKFVVIDFDGERNPNWRINTYNYDPLQVQANWNETSSSSKAYIQNKPDLSSYATKTDVQTVSAAIPDVSNLATKVELQTVSAAIPDTSDMATKTWVGNQGYITSIPATYVTDTELASAVSGLATKNELTTGLGNKQNTLTGITDVQVVQTLPVSPVSSVLYLIPET